MTDAEWKVWKFLRSGPLADYRFRRQVPVGRHIADFASHRARLVVEIDGGQHDRSQPKERARTKFLESQGYAVMRFWNNDVLQNTEGVYAIVARALQLKSPPPASPRRGSASSPIEGEVLGGAPIHA